MARHLSSVPAGPSPTDTPPTTSPDIPGRRLPVETSPAETLRDVLGWLADVDAEALSDAERIDTIAGAERMKAALAGMQARLTAVFADSQEEAITDQLLASPVGEGGVPWSRARAARQARRSVGSQVGLARSCSPSRGDEYAELARRLTREFPRTLASLGEGRGSEWHAQVLLREAAVLEPDGRAAVDERLGHQLGDMTPRGLTQAARRVVTELDPQAALKRQMKATTSRRVSVRPAADGMAYLTVFGPLVEVAGAYASLSAHAAAVIAGQVSEEDALGADGAIRGAGAIMADTALARIAGRGVGEGQSVDVQIVMTDRAATGTGDPARSGDEPAWVPGCGPVPAQAVREWLLDGDRPTTARLVRTGADGRDVVSVSRRRTYAGLLRHLLRLRDQTCRTPYCDAPIAADDHVRPFRSSRETTPAGGAGLCHRCNYTKETPGHLHTVVADGTDGPHTIEIRTPTGRTYLSQAPPLLGDGWQAAPATSSPSTSACP